MAARDSAEETGLATARNDARHAKASGTAASADRTPGLAATARQRIQATGHPGLRVGIAVSFAVAIVAAPVVGVDGVFEPLAPAQAQVSAPRASAVLEPVAFHAVPAEAPVSKEVPVELQGGGVAVSEADLQAAREHALAAGAAQAHAAVPDCTGNVVNPEAANGRIELNDLCVLPWTPDARRLRGDAALAIGRLNAAYFQAFGQDLCVNDAYRSFEEQAAVKAAKPGLAAPAGASNHGWALALDLCGGIEDDASPQFTWMLENAPRYGWDNPAWARAGGRGPHEPWHWEFVTAVAEQRAKAGLNPDNTGAAAETSTKSTKKSTTKSSSSKSSSSKSSKSKSSSSKSSSRN